MPINPVVAQAAARYGIPAGVLNGVYGMETSHGSNVSTSSAGAMGSFQFIRSTAASYGYPYTNATDARTFASQANAAARYLSDLYRQHGGNWDAALRAYSGGGYGLAQVQAQSQGGGTAGGPRGRAPGAPMPVPQGPTSYTIPGINRTPERHALLASYLLRQPAQSSNPIQGALSSSAGLLKTVGQMRAITDTPAQTVNVPGSPGAQTAGGGSAASMFPGGFKLGRIDQGQDLQANRPGGPVVAPGDGIVIAVPSDPSGFGPSYPVIHWTSGPFAGKTTYIGHTLSRVRPGQHVAAGQTIAVTGTRGVGNATVPGWAEVGYWGPGGPTGQGSSIAPAFR